MTNTKHPLNWMEPPTKKPKTTLQQKIDDQLEWYFLNKDNQQRWGSDDCITLNRDYATMLTNLNK